MTTMPDDHYTWLLQEYRRKLRQAINELRICGHWASAQDLEHFLEEHKPNGH